MSPKQLEQIKQRNTSPKKAKKLMNYREDDPMCANCSHRSSYTKQVFPSVHTVFTSMAFCKLGSFKVSMGGCCDMWESKEGETIDTNRFD